MTGKKEELDGARHGPQRRLNTGLDQHRLHGMLASTQRRFDRAHGRVEAFLADHHPVYVSYSGGKDSGVIAHLATRIDPTLPVCHFDAGFDFPETITHQDHAAARYGWDLRRYRCGDALEEMRRTGTWAHEAVDETDGSDDDWLNVTRLGPARMALEDTRAVGSIWGLRAQEAARRRALLGRTRGLWQRKADGQWVCCPIWDWTDDDVYAYHAVHDLPLNPVYEKLRDLGAPPDACRLGYIFDTGSLNLGRAVWLKRGWPDLWARLVEVLPLAATKA